MQGQKHSIKDWAKDDKPREKLLSKTPGALSDSELLAILIGSGTREHSAIDLAKQVLKLGKDNLLELGKLTVPQLTRIKGIGQAKAITIAAALELGRRRQIALSLERPLVKNSREVAAYLQAILRDLRHEVFGVIYLNSAGKILLDEIVSQGGLTSTVADPRLIFKKALIEEATSLILYHNHPSGSLRPSKPDKELTTKMKEAAQYLDIKLMDHIIVSEEGYFSFADQGLL
ncbi:MAG TPA: DNA repair protein RadC [Puia sp.]|jgi:DNA repair protein RadC|nr:DNA repair protein RadC [Puia sp.]